MTGHTRIEWRGSLGVDDDRHQRLMQDFIGFFCNLAAFKSERNESFRNYREILFGGVGGLSDIGYA